MRIAVIASLKRGLEHFVHRELGVFSAGDVRIRLFPTKYRPGLYNPRHEWEVVRWSVPALVAAQLRALLNRPRRYLRLLAEALATRSTVDFALAWFFAASMDGVDVLYATFADRKLFVAYYLKQISGKPLLVTLHAYELYDNPNPRLFPRALAACDRVVTVTEHNRALLTGRFGVDPAKVEVVRISVDLDDYRLAHKFVILIVAFFVERKGHEILFRALKQLAQDDLEVWVVGDEGAEEGLDVRALAARLGVGEQVAFFGKLSGAALKAVYRACDVFCLPCRTDSRGVAEGFPTVLAEAMAFGKPVITTRHVEIPSVVPAILVDENDVAGLAAAIRRSYLSAELRERLGEQNRRIAETLFSTRNAARTAEILAGLAQPGAAAPLAYAGRGSPADA